MRDALLLLDQAIALGREELAHLEAGDLEKAEAVDAGRNGIITQVLSQESLGASAEDSLDSLLAKLSELKELQASIIDRAGSLQKSVGEQLRRAGQEQKRHAGYGRATRPVSLVRSSYISRNS